MRVALCGLGKAGKRVLDEVIRDSETELACTLCKNGSDKAHRKLSEVLSANMPDVPVYPIEETDAAISDTHPDVIIDFSGKRAIKQLLPSCLAQGVNLVIGTTGFTDEEVRRFRDQVEMRQSMAMLCAPNITLGVNVMMHLAEIAAACLPGYDFVVTEKHYRKKTDVSATALRMSKRLSQVLKRDVPVNVVRAGGYIGLHEILCAGENERITLIHESFSRSAFAQGALLAAKHLHGRVGWMDMDDITRRYIRKCQDNLLE